MKGGFGVGREGGGTGGINTSREGRGERGDWSLAEGITAAGGL